MAKLYITRANGTSIAATPSGMTISDAGVVTTNAVNGLLAVDGSNTVTYTGSLIIAGSTGLQLNAETGTVKVAGLTVTASSGTLTISDGKTVTFDHTSTFTTTDAQTYTFPTTTATIARTDAGQTFTGTNTLSGTILTGTTTLGDGSGATAILASNLSGATDPTITFGNALITSSHGITLSAGVLTLPVGTAAAPTVKFSSFGWYENSSLGILLAFSSNPTFLAAYDGLSVASGGVIGFTNSTSAATTRDVKLTRGGGAAILQHGDADAAAAVAQTVRVQSVVAGTADIAGANWTMIGSKSTGSAASGDIIFQVGGKGAASTTVNTVNTGLTIKAGTTNNTNVGYPSVIIGSSAMATTATDGFLYIPTCAGPPAGTPTAVTGRVPMVWDSTNKKFYIYDGAWLGGTAPGVFS